MLSPSSTLPQDWLMFMGAGRVACPPHPLHNPWTARQAAKQYHACALINPSRPFLAPHVAQPTRSAQPA